MKKAVLTGIRQFEIIDVPKPVIKKDDDVLIRVLSAGVCGSDMHYYNEGKIGDQVIKFPFTIGHECSAVVEAVGKNVKALKPGTLVAVEPALSCHSCDQCRNGREHTCLNQKFLGCPGQAEGCLAEYIIMPEKNCFIVPAGIDNETAALIEPLTIGYYAASLAKRYFSDLDFDKKETAILGAGPIGLSVLLSLQFFGLSKTYITDLLNYRIKAAKASGAYWAAIANEPNTTKELLGDSSNGFDFVFECCGEQQALDQAIDILKPGGILLIVGIPEVDRVSFDISKIRRKEITIQNVRRQNNCTQKTIDITAAGKWSPGFMITHRYSLEQTAEAFNTVSGYSDGVIKAMINF